MRDGGPDDGSDDGGGAGDAGGGAGARSVALWREVLSEHARGREILRERPSHFFDPDFYRRVYPEIVEHRVDPYTHFDRNGREEGRFPNSYKRLEAILPDLGARIAPLARDPRIAAAIDAEAEDGNEGGAAVELLFELILLGPGIDAAVSDFGADYYVTLYPDIARLPMAPFLHYAQSGATEGRITLRDLRENTREGARPHDPARPTCLIAMHEFSRSGAPIVGLDMARAASETCNVVVLAMRGGPLIDAFVPYVRAVAVVERPAESMAHLPAAFGEADFAILNSVESFLFTRPLVERGIPFAAYLHEYAHYTLPSYKGIFSGLFADLLVFSSDHVRDSWRDLLADLAFDMDRDSLVLPQAELVAGGVTEGALEAARAELGRLIGEEVGDRRVIMGGGHAQWRKGTDLFVMAAQMARRRDADALFVWVGDGLNHEDIHFGVWMDMHIEQARRSMDGLHFLPAGPHYRTICRAADAMFMASRLDPLPNVVFDAVAAGCHVVAFDGATGFSDARYRGEALLHLVEYGDLGAAVDALMAAPPKAPLAAGEAEGAGTGAARHEDASGHGSAGVFARIRAALEARLGAQRVFAVGPGQYDVPVLFPPGPDFAAARTAEREKIWSLGRRMVWPSVDAARTAVARSQSRVHARMSVVPYARAAGAGGAVGAGGAEANGFALHVHAYYLDDLARDVAAHAAWRAADRVVVTTDTDEKAARIARILGRAGIAAEIAAVGNRGRDILPFMRLFSDDDGDGAPRAGDDAIWCHLHQKKSLGTSAGGDVWRRFLTTILLGDAEGLSVALERIRDPGCGLVGAFDPYMSGWAGSRRLLGGLPEALHPLPEHPLLFPIGNMFWTRAPVVRRMNALFPPDTPWPNEPIANDGTVFHLIERLWPSVAALEGMAAVFVEKADQRRI